MVGDTVSLHQNPPEAACPFDVYVWVPEVVRSDIHSQANVTECNGDVGVDLGSTIMNGIAGFVARGIACASMLPPPVPPPASPSPPPPPAPPATAAVELELTIDVDIASIGAPGSPERDAWASGLRTALGAQLGISAARIVVLSVNAGSVQVRLRIFDYEGLPTEATAAVSARSLVTQLAASSGSLLLPQGYVLVGAALSRPNSPPAPAPSVPPVRDTEEDQAVSSSDDMTTIAVIVGILGGGCCCLALGLAVWCFRKRKGQADEPSTGRPRSVWEFSKVAVALQSSQNAKI